MSSFLKHVDPATGRLVPDAHHDSDEPVLVAESNSGDTTRALAAEARARLERVLSQELQLLEDAYVVALRVAEERATSAQTALEQLQREHDELVSRHAEAIRKLDVLKELKDRLQSF